MEVGAVGNQNKKLTKQVSLMKKIFYFLVYLVLFIVGFTLLRLAKVLDIDSHARAESISKFFIMLIVLIAVTRWGIKLYKVLTDYEE